MDQANLEEPQPSTSGLSKASIKNEASSESESGDSEYDEDTKQNILLQKVTEDYNDELEEDLSKPKLIKNRKSYKRTSKMPTYLMGLMGEANLRFARGEYEMCEKMCFEIIRQAPYVFEPYVTLSQLYEGEHLDKCVQYLTIAAHLRPYDVDQWCRLAQMNIDIGNKRKAVTCYTKALKYSPGDYEIQKKRIQLLQDLGENSVCLNLKLSHLFLFRGSK